MALRGALSEGATVAIVGAGFIGCEVASSARALGLDVTLFDVLTSPMRGLGPLLGERCAALHRSHGVRLRLGVAIAGLTGEDGRVRAVELADGTRHEADVVVIALGAVPCTEWLAGSGLTLEPGVRCDATLTVEGDPDVLAAGDIASWPHPLAVGASIRVEHWTNAAEQGALAGRNAVVDAMASATAYRRRPVLLVGPVRRQDPGRRASPPGERLPPRRGVRRRRRLVAVAVRDGVLVGAVGFDAARRLPAYRGLVGRPFDLGATRAASTVQCRVGRHGDQLRG